MSASPSETTDLPETMLEAATIWHARLREPETDPIRKVARRTAFEAWRDANPHHRQAFKEISKLWDALAVPTAQVMAETRTPPRRRFSFLSQAMATAACFLLLVSGLIWQDDFTARLNADYRTVVGEETQLVLEDGSRVTLNSASALAVDFTPDRRAARLLKGEAWFDVASENARPFIVETPRGTIRVTGTKFNVRLDDNMAIVSLTEGQVELRSSAMADDAAPVILMPGHEARLLKSGVSGVTPFDMAAVTAWLRGQFVFYDTPLADVVAALNRHRNGHIVVINSDLNNLMVSGIFKTDEPDQALKMIADTLPVRVIRLTNSLVLLR